MGGTVCEGIAVGFRLGQPNPVLKALFKTGAFKP